MASKHRGDGSSGSFENHGPTTEFMFKATTRAQLL